MKKYFLFAASLAWLASCSNDDLNIDNTKDTPITIQSAGVAELTARAISDNNELVGTDANNTATMSVFVTNGSTDKYKASNVKWTHDGTSWTSEKTVLFEGAGSTQKIFACSPYAGTDATENITVTAADQIDWLVATTTSLTSNSVELTMTHALAKLVLIPSFGTELNGNNTITFVKVGSMYASGTLNISTNEWSEQVVANAPLTMTNNELLVIPMAQCASFSITVATGDNRTFATTISLAEVNNELAAGTQYNIKLQIGQNKVELGGITATSWGTSVEGGNLVTE